MSETTANFETTVKCMGGKKKKIDIIRKRLVLEIHWASYYVHVPPLILSSLPAPSNEICTSKVLYDSLNPGICHNTSSACEARCTRDVRETYTGRSTTAITTRHPPQYRKPFTVYANKIK
jgi:hypothetical protein